MTIEVEEVEVSNATPWTLNGEPYEHGPDDFGIVYLITDYNDDQYAEKKYVGCKEIYSNKKASVVNGRYRKKCKWASYRTYTGSSVALNKQIEKYGKDKFKFEVLHVIDQKEKSSLQYMEAEEIVNRKALLRDDYYNQMLNVRLSRGMHWAKKYHGIK